LIKHWSVDDWFRRDKPAQVCGRSPVSVQNGGDSASSRTGAYLLVPLRSLRPNRPDDGRIKFSMRQSNQKLITCCMWMQKDFFPQSQHLLVSHLAYSFIVKSATVATSSVKSQSWQLNANNKVTSIIGPSNFTLPAIVQSHHIPLLLSVWRYRLSLMIRLPIIRIWDSWVRSLSADTALRPTRSEFALVYCLRLGALRCPRMRDKFDLAACRSSVCL
jgi:hypothetical protein